MGTAAAKNSSLLAVGLFLLLAFVGVVAGLVMFGWGGNSYQTRLNLILVSCASVSLASPVLTAMLKRPYDIFHPLNFIALSLFFGVFGRIIYVLSVDSPVVTELLDDRPLESLVPGAILSAVGSVLFCAGYLVPQEMFLKLRWLTRTFESFNQKRFLAFLPLWFAISAVGVYFFLKATGFEFSGFSSISEKRRVLINGVDSSLGYVRLIGQELPKMVLLFLVGVWMMRKRTSLVVTLSLAAFTVLAIALPFVASSRGIVVLTMIMACVLINRIRPINVVAVVGVGVLALCVISGMLALRRVNSRGMQFGEALTEMGLEPIFGNHSFADVVKLSHIYEAVPDEIDYKYGSSFVSILYTPIPRSLWEDKPQVSMGREITEKVYNKGLLLKDKGGGTPPGLFAESIINFSVFGFPFAVLVAGALLRLLANSLDRVADYSVPGAVLYASVIPPYCLSMMSGDYTRSLTQSLTALVIVVGVTLVSRVKIGN
ncbi:hypothetical protein Pla22_48490 [Rubripirellula amarantea]|uniref:Oligosaccharide repeat unit polymerase n=1 Tax=Rubripirellula amarantea TaxID=2527999 RepID=A0A5C5WHX5_9BACT|nr:O-antigen polymerase [Rubripirellula amarantea]TWT49651.1 hypothetical protein Pla22_48490 [Rubripirellula amarantea]